MDVSDDLRAAHAVLVRRFLDQRPPLAGVLSAKAASSIDVGTTVANIHAVGIGRDEARRLGPAEIVRVYVSKKLPLAKISANLRIPSHVDGVPVHVLEAPPASILSCTANRFRPQRPAPAGISAGHVDVTVGTLGAWVRSTRAEDGGRLLALSNNHVFANVNQGVAGDVIVQPGTSDGGTREHHRIATLLRFVPILLGAGHQNRVDAAVAALDDNALALLEQCTIGTVKKVAPDVDEGDDVQKHGRTTGLTRGVVRDVVYDAVVGMDHANPAVHARFVDQIRVVAQPGSSFVQGGDSGSLVTTCGTPPEGVGLLFAGPPNGSYGLVNPLQAVLTELDITLA